MNELRKRAGSPLKAAGNWRAAPAPIAPAAVGAVRIGDGIVNAFTAIHKIERWLARLVLPAMLADLAGTGVWQFDPDQGLYRVSDRGEDRRLCHALLIKARSMVCHYDTSHADAECRSLITPPLPETLLAGLDDVASGDARLPWRCLLRTSATLPVWIAEGALDAYARHQHAPTLAPRPLTSLYTSAASAVRAFQRFLPRREGRYDICDDEELVWTVVVNNRHAKPTVVTVRRPVGLPMQRVHRVPPAQSRVYQSRDAAALPPGAGRATSERTKRRTRA